MNLTLEPEVKVNKRKERAEKFKKWKIKSENRNVQLSGNSQLNRNKKFKQ